MQDSVIFTDCADVVSRVIFSVVCRLYDHHDVSSRNDPLSISSTKRSNLLRHCGGACPSTRRDPRVPVHLSQIPAGRLIRRQVRLCADVRKLRLGELVTSTTTTPAFLVPVDRGSGQATTAAVEADVPGPVGCRLELRETVDGVNLAEYTSSIYTGVLNRAPKHITFSLIVIKQLQNY